MPLSWASHCWKLSEDSSGCLCGSRYDASSIQVACNMFLSASIRQCTALLQLMPSSRMLTTDRFSKAQLTDFQRLCCHLEFQFQLNHATFTQCCACSCVHIDAGMALIMSVTCKLPILCRWSCERFSYRSLTMDSLFHHHLLLQLTKKMTLTLPSYSS